MSRGIPEKAVNSLVESGTRWLDTLPSQKSKRVGRSYQWMRSPLYEPTLEVNQHECYGHSPLKRFERLRQCGIEGHIALWGYTIEIDPKFISLADQALKSESAFIGINNGSRVVILIPNENKAIFVHSG